MNDADSRSHVNRDSNHTSYMMQVPFSEAFSAVQGIDPYNHLLFIELVRKLKEIPIRFRGNLAVDLLQLPQVVSIRALVQFVVL